MFSMNTVDNREHEKYTGYGPGREMAEALIEIAWEEVLFPDDAYCVDTNEEFYFGDVLIGFYTPYFGLLFAADFGGLEPGFEVIIGPFQFWVRKNWPATFGLINQPPWWTTKEKEHDRG